MRNVINTISQTNIFFNDFTFLIIKQFFFVFNNNNKITFYFFKQLRFKILYRSLGFVYNFTTNYYNIKVKPIIENFQSSFVQCDEEAK